MQDDGGHLKYYAYMDMAKTKVFSAYMREEKGEWYTEENAVDALDKDGTYTTEIAAFEAWLVSLEGWATAGCTLWLTLEHYCCMQGRRIAAEPQSRPEQAAQHDTVKQLQSQLAQMQQKVAALQTQLAAAEEAVMHKADTCACRYRSRNLLQLFSDCQL